MDINFRLTFDVSPMIADALELSEDTMFETYYDDGKIIVQTVDDNDLVEDANCEFDECEERSHFCPHCSECTYYE